MTLPKLNNKAKRKGSHSETVVPQRLPPCIFFVKARQETFEETLRKSLGIVSSRAFSFGFVLLLEWQDIAGCSQKVGNSLA